MGNAENYEPDDRSLSLCDPSVQISVSEMWFILWWHTQCVSNPKKNTLKTLVPHTTLIPVHLLWCGDQNIPNSAREVRWFVTRWKKWNHVSELKSLLLYSIGTFHSVHLWVSPAASLGSRSSLRIPRCTGIVLFLTPPCLDSHSKDFAANTSFKMWEGGGAVRKKSRIQLRKQWVPQS